MIWLFILIPIILVAGIAIYLEKKSGMTPPDLTEQAMKIDEADKNNNVYKNSGGS
ncbi:hypothetical protein B0G93_102369 [Bacillus sp. V-88]|uniref:Uncharacterized protein n=1 Tax=Rossellomorea vietnamensis TaxID=218284 RepID=A0A6I6UP38_9BACI|nr:hypothetical protein [Rossellomorea vietnamensis]PRX79006.1 hypothetical protein B0G93_102369 [Bacillus sp. V-88]QHE60482.1 hypothetical protein FHE72_05060 [Rossellomorea vietnamensis]SLK16487.1 hypothetical protein SAMN06295884_102369 [Bacillus sp. V-88]